MISSRRDVRHSATVGMVGVICGTENYGHLVEIVVFFRESTRIYMYMKHDFSRYRSTAPVGNKKSRLRAAFLFYSRVN